jgi:hypothetical protein
MSYPSLLFTSATQGMAKASGAGGVSPLSALGEPTPPAPDTLQQAWTGKGGEPNAYHLPSGIASLEHWLDLNA